MELRFEGPKYEERSLLLLRLAGLEEALHGAVRRAEQAEVRAKQAEYRAEVYRKSDAAWARYARRVERHLEGARRVILWYRSVVAEQRLRQGLAL